MTRTRRYDVVILGGGLAGLTLARHLLLDTKKTILLLEKRASLPSPHQKVGESSVQVAGYYFSKVLDLEEHMLRDQLMKYNLRFYWPSTGRDNSRFEDYSHSYIRPFSNVASYQLDRNTFEAEVLRRNRQDPRFTIELEALKLDVELAEGGAEHQVRYQLGRQGESRQVSTHWVVDTTGRSKHLERRMGLAKKNSIDHGSFFWWVEGLVDIDHLTDASRREVRLKKERRHTGHLPFWLATNHFCAEGLWFWVIPLQGKTSLGLVFDKRVIDPRDVFTVEKATRWVCEHFPCFARDLPQRKVLDFGGLKSYSYDCQQTLSAQRWALAGESGRFTDPLYSPGSDLIAIYNTLIVDAIKTDDPAQLASKCELYEQAMRVVYSAYVPSYELSYDALGDQEVFSLKYTWELAIYFAYYVFPFINDFFTERRFLLAFMRLFSRLGPINRGLQGYLSDYYQWKRQHRQPLKEPVFFDFTEIQTLSLAEKTFYEVGVEIDQAKRILAQQLENLEEMALWVAAHVAAVVLEEPQAVENRQFVEGFRIQRLQFDGEDFRRRWAECESCEESYPWRLDPRVMDCFRSASEVERLS